MIEKNLYEEIKNFALNAKDASDSLTFENKEGTYKIFYHTLGERKVDNTLRNMRYDIVRVNFDFAEHLIISLTAFAPVGFCQYFKVTHNDWGIQSIRPTKCPL